MFSKVWQAALTISPEYQPWKTGLAKDESSGKWFLVSSSGKNMECRVVTLDPNQHLRWAGMAARQTVNKTVQRGAETERVSTSSKWEFVCWFDVAYLHVHRLTPAPTRPAYQGIVNMLQTFLWKAAEGKMLNVPSKHNAIMNLEHITDIEENRLLAAMDRGT